MAITQALVLTLLCLQASLTLRFGNFPQSIYPRIYGPVLSSKLSADILAEIIDRYDIVTMPSITNTVNLKNALQKLSCSHDIFFTERQMMEGLEQPEQYAIAYKKDAVTLSDFLRHEPTGMLTARVKINMSGQEFILGVGHFPGDYALEILEKVPRAFETLKSIYNLETAIFSGDFNTVSRFMNKTQADSLTVSRNSTYKWFVNWEDNTFNAPLISGAAARILTAGAIRYWVTSRSATILNTTSYFGLTGNEASGLVLFYPVEIELKEPIKRPY